jgi:hypothetical protein
MTGKLVIKATRITVGLILKLLMPLVEEGCCSYIFDAKNALKRKKSASSHTAGIQVTSDKNYWY